MEGRILREDGSEANVNEIGELYLKGPVIALGYHNNDKANKETFVNGWLRTGDQFRLDQDGYLLYELFCIHAGLADSCFVFSFADRSKVGLDSCCCWVCALTGLVK
jgi:Acyl-CoA synthetases (AMP-forming)/AMP-acid ligases II